VIREALPADALAICRVHQEAVRGLCNQHYTRDEIEAWIGRRVPEDYARDIAELEVLVATNDSDGVMGFAVLDVAEHEVMAVYVHPTAAHDGLGRVLLTRLEAIAVEHGLTELHLDGSLNAFEFYARSGYAPIEARIHRLGSGTELRCVFMTKTL
jgi:putative acetyltransferase